MNQGILLYTDDSGVGGVAQYNHDLVKGLATLGHKVTCVQSKSDNPLVSLQKELGIQHVWFDFDTGKDFGRTLTNQADAKNILSSYKPDLIIFSDCCPLSNFAAKQITIELGIPYITVIGFVAPYLAERFAAYLDDLSHQYTQAKAVIAVSNENLALLHKLFRLPNNKGQVIYYGRSAQYFTPPALSVRERLRQEFGIPSNAIVCFTSARLEAVKGYQYQLEAIKQLKQSEVWDKIYFVWAGAGSLETQLKDAIEQLGVSNQVKLLGQRWDVQDWLDTSDIFVLPSELEGMPLCIMEAMAKGSPIIASAVSGIPEELGNTGKLLTDPKVDPQATITELVTTIQAWSGNAELRHSIGQDCKKRAEEMFREERMVKETVEVIERALLPSGDYISPGFSIVLPDKYFPNMIAGDANACPWSYLRREVSHNWYVDKRQPTVGFLSRDEAHILYNTALKFKGKKALEIGCWLGWSACHLALAGVELDVVDPLLERSEFYESVSNSLRAAGILESVNLMAGYSPQKVEELAVRLQRKWSLIFIDGNHDAPAPLNDAIACEQLAESDALILFHDLASPDVAQGLEYLKQRGWNTIVYQTMQIMGVAWRGNVEPVKHQPDPRVNWTLPTHLQDYLISYQSEYVPLNCHGFIKQNNKLYTKQFYELLQDGSHRSAQAILPLVLKLIQPISSVIDVGCGVGTWLSVFAELGIEDYLGIDGEYVDRTILQIPQDKFCPCDITKPLEMQREFDLVVSMEVAEHLPQEDAVTFVNYLTRLGKVVLFSAAIPFQGGEGHVNEQWPQYWIEIFQNHGYVVIDCLREKIWNNLNIEPWYAQNLLIFVREECLKQYPYLTEQAKKNSHTQLAIVHPRIYTNSLLQNSKGFISLQRSPLVSVIIPCYKQAHFLPETVASVVSQTYENWEIIIVNDGSPDNTSEVVQQLIELYSKIKIQLIEKENGGLASARNAGIEVARGEYILPLDADDKLDINSISRLVKIAVNQGELCVAFGSYEMFGIEYKQIISADLYSPENIKSFNMLHPSSLFPKKVWQLVGGYRTDMVAQGYEDWNFWLSCHQKNIPFRGTREIIIYYRRHHDSMYFLESRPNHNKLYAELIFNHPQLFGVDQIRESANIILRNKNIVNDSSKFELSQIQNIIKFYQNNPFDTSSLTNICKLRKQITDLLLSLDPDDLKIVFLSDLGKVHQILLTSGIRNELLTEKEQNFVNNLSAQIPKGFDEPKAIQYLLAAMLYRRADQLPIQFELNHIPQWLLNDYLKFILDAPAYFQEIGEINEYYHYMQICLDYLHTNISSKPNSKLWQDVASFFTQNANFIPLYFNSENLRDIYTKRADIMEFALRSKAHQIDYEFPERSLERKKIRLGILAAHFGPQTETFTTLPVYKDLNWNDFEIILYTINSNNHRLERYCAGHADAFVTLPQDLPTQVQTIRNGDLDILLIGTNVTAVTNLITLLALHRLARVQLTCFSSPVTTGIRNIDYYISGKLTELLHNAQQHYREQLITVDGTGYCCDYLYEPNISIKHDRKSIGIADESIVFISGANFYKIVPELRETWAKIIASVPSSVLVLYPFSPSWSNAYEATPFMNSMKSIFAKYGIAEERLIVLDALPSRSDVKECLKLGDVYLDSYPYSGANSTVDPLEVGLPTVVMDGNSLRSRQAAALLRELQISDLIADGEESYIKLAIALGTNPELRQRKSNQIKERMQANPRFLDSRAYSAQMGEIFQRIFYKYQADALTENFKLRNTNVIIFPDWNQPEEVLYQDLASVITSLVNHPDKNQLTLLIHQGNLAEEDANILLADITMNLLLEEELDVADGLEISLVGQLSEMQAGALIQRLQSRIVLEHENKEAIAAAKAETIPVYNLYSFSSSTS